MRVVVDNHKGADAHFAAALREGLGGAGFDVESRQPLPQTLYDTTVHFVVEGVSVRVPADISRRELAIVAAVVREPSLGDTASDSARELSRSTRAKRVAYSRG